MVVPASLRKEAGTTYYEISVHLSAAKLLLQAVGAHSDERGGSTDQQGHHDQHRDARRTGERQLRDGLDVLHLNGGGTRGLRGKTQQILTRVQVPRCRGDIIRGCRSDSSRCV